MSEPIKLPPMPAALLISGPPLAVELQMQSYARLAVEQNTEALRAECDALRADAADFHMAYRMKCDEETKVQAVELERLRAERDALRAELARLTTLRPASECRSTGLALWHFASGAATVSRKVQIGSIGWTPLPKVKETTNG